MRWLAAYAALRIAAFIRFPHCAEDAYITFRAARNWLRFGAPTFNPGDPSWPASSPLWTVWMLAGTAYVEWWSRLGSLVAECFLLVAVNRMLGRKGAIAFGILLACYQCTLAISLSGIEMFAMVAAFAWALLGSRVAVFLLLISRPEGVVLAAIASWGRWRRNWPWLLAGVGVWLGMAWLTHSLMPAGVSAKVGTYGLHLFKGVRWLAMFWPGGGLEQKSMCALGIGLVVLLWWVRLKGPALTFALTGLGLLAAYFVAGSVYFFWYMALPMCAAMVAIASACTRLKRGLALAGLIAAASWTTAYPLYRWEWQYMRLSAVSSQLALIPIPGLVVMDAIGVTGWQHPDLTFIDVIGLSSHRSEALRKEHEDGWLTDLIQEEHPDAVVCKLAEVMNNKPDAGDGRPFRVKAMLVGSLINIRGEGKVACGLIGFEQRQIDQDVIFILREPKPKDVILILRDLKP